MIPSISVLRSFPSFIAIVLGLLGQSSAGMAEEAIPTVLVVVGAEGAEEYGPKFLKSASLWKEAAMAAGASFEDIGIVPGTDDSDRLKARLRELSADPAGGPLWLVLIGHGTFDGRAAKFNVRGPDFTDTELAGWLKDFSRPLAVINTASSSGPFLTTLKGKDRVIITATKSAAEVNYARFGEYFAEAIHGKEEADLDNDDQVSLLEAFLYSADQVSGFYEKEGRLATEHAQIDDTGDGLGTRPDAFEGVLATEVAKEGATPDGELAHQFILVPNAFERRLTAAQREKRDALEREVKALTRKRKELGDDAYYAQIEPLLIEIARIYESVKEPAAPDPPAAAVPPGPAPAGAPKAEEKKSP